MRVPFFVTRKMQQIVSYESQYADENFLKNVKTGDETWVYGYDVETKVQSSHWMGKLSP